MPSHRLLVLLLALLAAPAAAEEEREPLVTDRPDVAESAVTVGVGTVQLETGLFYERARGGDPELLATPTLLRIGTGPDTEIRFESDGLLFEDSRRRVADLAVGMKWNLLDEEALALGVLAHLRLPTGSAAFRAEAVEPEVKLLLDADLDDRWGLGFNVGAALPQDTGTRFLQPGFALSLGREVGDGVRLYGEVFGVGPDSLGGPFLMGADTGITVLLSSDVQWDFSYARGLSGEGLDWGLGTGVSARF